MIEQLVDKDILAKEGEGAATTYKIGNAFIHSSAVLTRAIDLGIEEMKKRGEIWNDRKCPIYVQNYANSC